MTRFYLCSTARSGSTVLCDDLGRHPNVLCLNEPIKRPGSEDLAGIEDRWLAQNGYASGGVRCWFQRGGTLADYYGYLEEEAARAGVGALGIKIGQGEVAAVEEERTGRPAPAPLWAEKVVFLTRRNLARQAISNFVAVARRAEEGVMPNEKGFTPSGRRYVVAPGMVVKRVEKVKEQSRAALEYLTAAGAAVFPVEYEDYLAGRKSVLGRVFAFLGVDATVAIPPSDYSIMTGQDLSAVVENLDELRKAVTAVGWEL